MEAPTLSPAPWIQDGQELYISFTELFDMLDDGPPYISRRAMQEAFHKFRKEASRA